jgi:hypothetical protein
VEVVALCIYRAEVGREKQLQGHYVDSRGSSLEIQ